MLDYIQLTNVSGTNLPCAANSIPSAPVSPQLSKGFNPSFRRLISTCIELEAMPVASCSQVWEMTV